MASRSYRFLNPLDFMGGSPLRYNSKAVKVYPCIVRTPAGEGSLRPG